MSVILNGTDDPYLAPAGSVVLNLITASRVVLALALLGSTPVQRKFALLDAATAALLTLVESGGDGNAALYTSVTGNVLLLGVPDDTSEAPGTRLVAPTSVDDPGTALPIDFAGGTSGGAPVGKVIVQAKEGSSDVVRRIVALDASTGARLGSAQPAAGTTGEIDVPTLDPVVVVGLPHSAERSYAYLVTPDAL